MGGAGGLVSVSIDLDRLGLYHDIHGLADPDDALREVVLRRGLPRYLEIFARRGIAATFFVVGSDLAADGRHEAGRALVRDAARAGHELASHSHDHPYGLHLMSRPDVEQQIDRAHAAIAEIAGVAPAGFRAPGYNLSPTVLSVLAARGYRYDSSILPAPLYQMAKAAVMAGMRIVGRPSRSELGDPRMTLAPLDPYRPDPARPWRRGQSTLVELPMAVTPLLRLWVIGTTVLASPEAVRQRLLDGVEARPHVNFEMHGIDLIGAEEDGISPALVTKQPDLRVPLETKLRAFEATLDRLAHQREFVTLREVATRVQRDGSM